MATVLSMPLKCSDHPDRLVVKKWGRRPHGYTGLVCDPRAQQHHDEGTMTRHYQPKECQLYHDHIPDCWMARVAHHSVPVGQTFYYDCFIEANGLPDEKKMEKEASCHKCKKNNESVTVGPDQFPKLLELEDETGDLENLDLKIWDFLTEALVYPDDVALSIMDVLGVKYKPCSPFRYEKEVLIAWHVSVNGEGADSGVIVNSWESAICLHDKPELREKAEKMFKTKL